MNHAIPTLHTRIKCCFFLGMWSLVMSGPAYAQEQAPKATKQSPKTRTYALIVANNGSMDEGVKALKYADDDGARYYETFASMAQETTLLTVLDDDSQRVFPKLVSKTQAPTRRALRRSVAKLAASIKADRAKGVKSEVYLVFTGHGNVDKKGQGYLSLQDGRLSRAQLLQEVLKPLSDASFTHLIIDACHAYFMVQSRGGPQWKDDRSAQPLDDEFQAYMRTSKGPSKRPPNLGVILSTSGTAEVHEWSRYRAGVFSHQLRSALLGAADVNQDGRITYLEVEAYLAAANAGVTNPKARINVWAKAPAQNRAHPLIRTSAFRDATIMTIAKGTKGRLSVEDARGLRYMDVHRDPQVESTIILLKAPVNGRAYTLRTSDKEASVTLKSPKINTSALAFADIQNQARSSVEESFRTQLFSTPFGPGFFAGFQAARRESEEQVQVQVIEAPASSSFSSGIHLGYGLSAPLLNASGVQHNLSLSVPFTHQQGWLVGPTLGYGFSTHSVEDTSAFLSGNGTNGASLHRIHVGVQVGYRLTPSSSMSVEPLLSAASQSLIVTGNQTTADPFGLRAEAGARLGVFTNTQVPLYLHAGMAANVVRRTGTQDSAQSVFWTPFASIEAKLAQW